MFRLKFYAATFALFIGLLTTFNQTAQAESWSWENLFSFGSSENAVAVSPSDPIPVFTRGNDAATGAAGPVVFGDVNDDGDLDFAYPSAGGVSIRKNNGTGTFSAGSTVAVSGNPDTVELGDVDGDGDLDRALPSIFNGSSTISMNDGAGSFTAGNEALVIDPLLPQKAYWVSFGDVDGDGDVDVAVNYNSNVAIWLNDYGKALKPTITTSFSPASIKPGEQSTVSMIISNNNTTELLTYGSFTDTLTNMTVVSGSEQASCYETNVLVSATSVKITNLMIPANGFCWVFFKVTSNVPGVHPNTTSGVKTMQTDTGAPSNTANLTVLGPPDLTVTKTHAGNFTQGNLGKTYTITVSNSGGAATSGTVGITDTLPGGLTATGISGTGWNCTLNTLVCTRSDALAGGSSYPAITLTVNVASNAPTGVTNIVTVSGG